MVQGNRVVQARSETAIFRGFEIILKGRDPWDAPYFTQRICGICSSFHALASCHAIEAAAKAKVPPNGILLRNVITGVDLLQNHIRHFYLLALWDWVTPPRGHPFAGGYTRDFRLSGAHTAMFHEHYWLGVDHARLAHEALALVGGKAPHNHGIIPGGVSMFPNDEVLRTLEERIGRLKSFIEEVYLPDVLTLKRFYPDYLHVGRTSENYLSFGLFPRPDGGWHFPPGAIVAAKKEAVDFRAIRESVAFSWFSGEGGKIGVEDTVPDMSRPGAYSFVKAPRYKGFACEGGPLARDALGTREAKEGNSVLARHEARAREALRTAQLLKHWLGELRPGEPARDHFVIPRSCRGMGVTDAMRGTLLHYIDIKGGRIRRYQIVTPTAWNLSPRDDSGQPGPLEEALAGTEIGDLEQPIEIGRVIRSFDPCYSCSAHVLQLDRGTKTVMEVRA